MAEGYRWYHSVSLDWIRARKHVFTATELRGLVPAYKRWLRKKDPFAVDPDFSALVAEKLSNVNGVDVNTFGWAARGHIMEPYAIAEHNRINALEHRVYHWDDSIVADLDRKVGFSPDALDVKQDDLAYECFDPVFMKPVPCIADSRKLAESGCLKHMVEVKCYSPGKHMKAILSDKKDLDERYQIAVGMLVCDAIETGSLVFYNPSINELGRGAYYQADYTRKELKEEIGLMQKILDLACRHLDDTLNRLGKKCCTSVYTEKEIYGRFVEQERNVNEIP